MSPAGSSKLLTALIAAVIVAMGLGVVGASPALAQATSDPLLPEQWHLEHIRTFDAWQVGQGAEVVIAVVDTGVDGTHPDLAGRVLPGVDFIDPDTPPDDPNGHGTLVAGIVAAVADNAEGGSGVAPQASILPVRVLDGDGAGSSGTVARGIRWAVENGAHIVNLSLAEVGERETDLDDLISTEVEVAIREAHDAGVLVVVAAGNDGREEVPYDDDLPAIVVASSNAEDGLWERSNVDGRTLLAPGVGIVSTWRDHGYAKATGTSFAAPVASGAAAVLVSAGMTPHDARLRIMGTTADVGSGAGRLDLGEAAGVPPGAGEEPPPEDDGVQEAGTDGDTRPEPQPTPTPAPQPRPEPRPEPAPSTSRPPATSSPPTPSARPSDDDDDEAAEPPTISRPPPQDPAAAPREPTLDFDEFGDGGRELAQGEDDDDQLAWLDFAPQEGAPARAADLPRGLLAFAVLLLGATGFAVASTSIQQRKVAAARRRYQGMPVARRAGPGGARAPGRRPAV